MLQSLLPLGNPWVVASTSLPSRAWPVRLDERCILDDSSWNQRHRSASSLPSYARAANMGARLLVAGSAFGLMASIRARHKPQASSRRQCGKIDLRALNAVSGSNVCSSGLHPSSSSSATTPKVARRGGGSKRRRGGGGRGLQMEWELPANNRTPAHYQKTPRKTPSFMPAQRDPVPRYPLERIFAIDVECVAIGKTHERSARAPCSVALVDASGRLLYEASIMPSVEIVSYLTPFTGLGPGDLEKKGAQPLEVVCAQLRKHLPRDAILVGQRPQGDIEWLGLREGVDFEDCVDLADVFRGSSGQGCSLRHETLVLLGRQPQGHADPRWDAEVSVDLYLKAAMASPAELREMQARLTSGPNWPPRPSLARRLGWRVDGVCLSMFSDLNCICGRPCEGYSAQRF